MRMMMLLRYTDLNEVIGMVIKTLGGLVKEKGWKVGRKGF